MSDIYREIAKTLRANYQCAADTDDISEFLRKEIEKNFSAKKSCEMCGEEPPYIAHTFCGERCANDYIIGKHKVRQ